MTGRGSVRPASVRVVSREEKVTSVRQAAAVCNVTPAVAPAVALSWATHRSAMDIAAVAPGAEAYRSA
jgi:hypothetical protein